jgi:NAD(P)-dependent dehydrogenase (short-subunit alcohol dehydrogenase family)
MNTKTSSLPLSGRVALVTGASGGIGRATALLLAQQGARVAVVARRADAGEETVRLITASGGQATFLRADVTDEADHAAAVKRTREVYGRLDIAVNNAGAEGQFGPSIAEQTAENFDAVFDVNVRGLVFALKHQAAGRS